MHPYRLIPIVALAGLASAAIAFGCVSTDCEFTATCPPASSGGLDATDGDIDAAPPGCDAGKDPRNQPACVDDSFGVFVAPSGKPDNPGTKGAPIDSVAHAFDRIDAKKRRIYVCEGTYNEAIKLDASRDGISIFGGWNCSTWTASDQKAVFTPSQGEALKVSSLKKPIDISDLELRSSDRGQTVAESSIAAHVSESNTVRFVRVLFKASKGGNASPASQPTSNYHTGNKNGNSPDGGAGGPKRECSCPTYGTSVGGAGGNGGTGVTLNGQPGAGGDATPVKPAPMGGFDGSGGIGAMNPNGSCQNAIAGSIGSARLAGVGANKFGTVSLAGWTPANGTDGEHGNPGQGGGGGGGDNVANSGNGGGGGGCGGCGGAGGKGGRGGGSSIALLIDRTKVVIEGCEFYASDGGSGGAGAAGEQGDLGGNGSAGGTGACAGRNGGTGAGGGGGGGGAGGLSAGIVFSGDAPSVDGQPVGDSDNHPAVRALGEPGQRGAKGTGAPARVGGPLQGAPGLDGTDGVGGKKAAIIAL